MLKEIAEKYYDEILYFEKKLCAIPAPSGFEDKRAEFCLEFLKSAGAENVYIDSAKNVIFLPDENAEKLTLFMAHTDTVFPDTEPMEIKEYEQKLYCPGVCDDTASVAIMLMCIKHMLQNNIFMKGLMFSANSCEEGLGNLKGSRQIFTDFEGRNSKMYTFDGSMKSVTNKSVGSHRYEVTVETEGGHSFSSFGNRNAIAVISDLVTEIYKIDVPTDGNSKTTYNVGIVSGGTSVNTICQSASILCEYRSDSLYCLEKMEKKFFKIFKKTEKKCRKLIVKKVGDRPCMNDVDGKILAQMTDIAKRAQAKYSDFDVIERSGSTDCNIPHSLGIPAVSPGIYIGGGEHTREEWLLKESLKKGFCAAMEIILTELELMK
ncbi:MAG: M20/M25/M40 family metallo-hydrolase [Monoglobales bacterium]